jgi:hypothetical protein
VRQFGLLRFRYTTITIIGALSGWCRKYFEASVKCSSDSDKREWLSGPCHLAVFAV